MAILAQLLEVDAEPDGAATRDDAHHRVRGAASVPQRGQAVTDLAMDEPAAKYILLRQAHLSQLPLAITDGGL